MDSFKKINWKYVLIALFIVVIIALFIMNGYLDADSSMEEKFNGQEQVVNQPVAKPTTTTGAEIEKKLPEAEIILYYATWCGYSKAFLPEWVKFENIGKARLPQVRITSVRCEDGNESVCTEKGVTGYPTVILYLKNGREVNFDGPREAEKLVEFVEKNVPRL